MNDKTNALLDVPTLKYGYRLRGHDYEKSLVNELPRMVSENLSLYEVDELIDRTAANAAHEAAIAEIEAKHAEVVAGLRDALEPFVKHNASTEMVTISVWSGDIARARRVLKDSQP